MELRRLEGARRAADHLHPPTTQQFIIINVRLSRLRNLANIFVVSFVQFVLVRRASNF